MERKKKVVEEPSMKKSSETCITEEELQKIKEMRVYGFDDSIQVAKNLMGSIHENLLQGDLVFAYRSTAPSNKSPLFQVVVVNDLRRGNDCQLYPTPKFSVSIITSGYSAYIPHMPVEYLDEVVAELEDGKAEKKIIENFRIIVEDLKEKWEGK